MIVVSYRSCLAQHPTTPASESCGGRGFHTLSNHLTSTKHTDTRGVHFITPEKSNKNLTLLQHVSHLNTSYNSDCNYHFVICQSDNRLCCLQITKNIAPTQPIQKSNTAKTENDAHATTTNIWEESVLTIYHLSVSDTGQVWHHLCFVADVM